MSDAQTELPGRRGVLDAAALLFVQRGYAGTTLRQIASAAGIKAGSIYHHFDSKQQLFISVLDDGIAVMVNAFTDVATTGPTDNRRADTDLADIDSARVHAHVRAHLGALFEHGPYTAAHVTAFFSAPPEIREPAIAKRDHYEDMWNELLDDLFPSINVKELRLHRLLLFGAMNSTIEWFDPRGDISLDQLARRVTSHFMHGVPQ